MECEKLVLKNGLRLLMIPMDSVDSVTAMVLVGAGARYETQETNGVAHFAEHMFFKGTKRRPTALDLSKTLDSVGAAFNAGTGYELTRFFVKSASKHLNLALDVLSDILLNSTLDAKEIEKEKGVVVEEINMIKDDPRRYVGSVFNSLLYGNTPLGRDVAGEKETVQSFDRGAFTKYLGSLYQGKNSVVVLAGKFDPRKVQNLVEEFFGRLGNKSTQKYEPQEESQKSQAVKIFYKDTDQVHLALGVRTFKRTHPDRYELAVLDSVLGSGMSSRLFTEVREKRGLAYYVYSDFDSYHDVGNFSVGAGVNKEKLKEAIKVILGEFQKIATSPVAEEELTKAKEYIKGHFILSLENTMAVADFYGDNEILEGKVVSPEEEMAKIDAVTALDLQKVAKRIFVGEGLNLALVGPVKGEEKLRDILII